MSTHPAVQLAQALVRIPSFTPVHSIHRTAGRNTLQLLNQHARASGATTKWLKFSGDHEKWDYPVDNLYVEWTFGNPDCSPAANLCFIGHTDVVPLGDESAWTHPPFGGEIVNHYLYGRGATDMKGAVAAFFSAVATAAARGKLANMRLGAIITTDEEWAAVNGTRKVLHWLKKSGKSYDAFLVGEPSSTDVVGSHIKLGRRGSINGKLVVKGTQGHAAYPDSFINPNHTLALALSILDNHPFNDRTPHMPASNFETIWLNSGDPDATAVIPGSAEAGWNVRFTPRYTPQQVVEALQTALAHPPGWAQRHPATPFLPSVTVQANLHSVSLPYRSTPGNLTAKLREAIRVINAQAPEINCDGGTTDGRFVHEHFPNAEVVEFGPAECGGLTYDGKMPADYRQRGGMHQVDERIALADLEGLHDIYRRLLENY